MKVAVVGTGYVGLVVGACLAEAGNDVICADADTSRVSRLHRGDVPPYEAMLEQLIGLTLEAGHLSFTTDLTGAVRASYVVLVAVEAATHEGCCGVAARSLPNVARLIGRATNSPKVVGIKGIVPVGTVRRVRGVIQNEAAFPVHVCANPDFLEEGRAVAGFMRPERIVIGADSAHADHVLRELYAPFASNGDTLLSMDPASAELATSGRMSVAVSFARPSTRSSPARSVLSSRC